MTSRGDQSRARRDRELERIRRKYHSESTGGGVSSASSNSSAPSGPTRTQPTGKRPDNQVVRHGFPHQATVLTFDPVQKLLAVGTKNGSLRIFGRPGVDVHVRHEGDPAILQVLFLVNEGAIITACNDDTINLWNIRQKIPDIVHSLKFQKERITSAHLPLHSKWLYVGTEKGNVHVINIESFCMSGYIINWNKLIDLSQKEHPGSVVHLSDNPSDSSRLLIGFDSSLLVLWDLRARSVDVRWHATEKLHGVCWHADGSRLMTSHADGSLCVWSLKTPGRPVSQTYPHGKSGESDKPDSCWPIRTLYWLSSKSGEPHVLFSGGLSRESSISANPSITVMQAKSTTVLEMENNVVDFIPLVDTPYISEAQDPYGIAVLLQNDLVVVDLTTPGFPCFENPYQMDLHDSPVTCCSYLADCPADLVPALYTVGTAKQSRSGFSEKEWPITGGSWGTGGNSYPEMVITGHADGSVRFWDATGVSFQVLYKLKNSRVLEKPSRSQESEEDDCLAVHHVYLCKESRQLAVAGGAAYVVLYEFSRQERVTETKCLDVPLVYESYDDMDHFASPVITASSSPKSSSDSDKKEGGSCQLRVRAGAIRRAAGYQARLVCLTPSLQSGPCAQTASITSLSLNSAYSLLAYGNDTGLAVIDTARRVCLLSLGTPDLYGPADPFQRSPRSPKQKQVQQTCHESTEPSSKSPETEQISSTCLSPTNSSAGGGATTPRGGATTPRGGPHTSSSVQVSAALAEVRRAKSQGTRRLMRACSAMEECLTGPSLPHHPSHQQLFSSGTFTFPMSAASSSSCPGAGARLRRDRQCRSVERLESQNISHSSSLSSLDNMGSEAISCLEFAETYAKKSDLGVSTCLLVGTSFGSTLIVQFMMPRGADRSNSALTVTPTGSIYRLNGVMQCIALLDTAGSRIFAPSDPWRENNKDKTRSVVRSSPGDSSSCSAETSCCQQLVLVSDKQARVVALPSQTCTFKVQLSDSAFAVCAQIVPVKNDSYCLICYMTNGRLCTYSIPSLQPLLDIDFLPLNDLNFQTNRSRLADPMLAIWGQQMVVFEDTTNISRMFCISSFGHGLYVCSPSEIQKFTVSAEFCAQLPDMVGDLFMPCEMPEPPQQGFFKGLFGGSRTLDREELFGEQAGKAGRAVTSRMFSSAGSSQLDQLNQRAAGAAGGEVSRARQLMIERGQKLSKLEDRTEQLMTEADSFSSTAHQLMLRYKEKKWYQL